MKTLIKFNFLLLLFFCLNITVNANWKKDGNIKLHTGSESDSYLKDEKKDSLPSGVTKDWLNKLTDERGNRIIPEEEPVTDAMQQNTFDGDLIGINYGKSVSNAGDVNGDGFDDVIIGDPNGNGGGGTNSGRAYIYYGGTVINSTADVILTGGAVNNYFGNSVSYAGDVNSDGYDDVIVGADGYSSFTGRAYIYFGGVSMNSVADVILTGEFANNQFGSSVSGAGDVNNDGFSDVIVGAYAASSYTGKAYIYYGGSSMNNIADVIMTGGNSNDNFGYSVSGAGDVNGDGYHDVICGAYGFNGIGKTYIYFGGSAMDNTADVTMFGGGLVDFFGASVSNAGDVNDDGYSDVIVGAYGNNSNTGRAYIYFGGVSMNNIADVTMTGEAANNSFGYSVSEAGDVNGDGFADVYVGAYGFSSSKGRAYLYYGGANMNNVVDIYMTGETSGNYFGYSVSGGGDVNGDGFADMISGAFGYNSSTGRAYVFTNTMTGTDIPDISLKGNSSDTAFGCSVSSAGDVNRDGFTDIIVGETSYSTQIGRAFIFFGGITMDNVADVTMTGESPKDDFGSSVSYAGDVNGDGYDDVIVGAPLYGIASSHGRIYIYYGGAAMNNVADFIVEGDAINSLLGICVSDAGDVNDDGFDDVIAGATSPSLPGGKVYIYFGGSPMNNVPDVTMSDENFGNENGFGVSVSGAGDVNGEGYDDVIVGYTGHSNNFGGAYIFFGGTSMNSIPDVTMTGESSYDDFGRSVSSAGDVNGDGYQDVIVGAPYYSTHTGRAYIYFGGVSMNNAADVVMTGQSTNNLFGLSVSSAGDVNGDVYDDVIVGAQYYSVSTGRAYIYFGGSSMNNITDVTMTGEENDIFGSSVSSAGDVNGDEYDDLIAGAPGYNSAPGSAYIYLSSPPDNRKNLFLFGAIQGMYDPVLDTEVPDTIKVYLRNSTSPFARVDSSKNILLGPQTGQYFLFRNVQNSKPYYIEVTHRNALTTWSAVPVTFINSDASIAYSVNSTYAYGNNEIQVDNSPYDVFAFYSGDVNQNGSIDLADVLEIYNDANSFITGYVVTDLTGNDAVDLTDLLMAYNNSVGFVSVVRP